MVLNHSIKLFDITKFQYESLLSLVYNMLTLLTLKRKLTHSPFYIDITLVANSTLEDFIPSHHHHHHPIHKARCINELAPGAMHRQTSIKRDAANTL